MVNDPSASALEIALSAFRSKRAAKAPEVEEQSHAQAEVDVAKAALDKFREAREFRDQVGTTRLTLKQFILSDDFAAPWLKGTTPPGAPLLTPVAEAIVDAIDGKPITTIDDATHQRIFGCPLGKLPLRKAKEYVLSGGGRSGKTSRFLIVVAVWCAWTVPLRLVEGQDAYALISAPTNKLSLRAKGYASGLIRMSPVLRRYVIADNTESTKIRRPDGITVSIEITTKGPLGGRAGTSVFYGADEAEFFPKDGGAFDLEKEMEGASQRVETGGVVAVVSTPLIDGEGYMQRTIYRERGRHATVLAIENVWTSELNPHWDPTGEKEASYRAKYGDENADREYRGKPLARGTRRFFDAKKLREAAERKSPSGVDIVGVGAGSDLGFRQDGCVLIVVRRFENSMIAVPSIGMQTAHPSEARLLPSVVCGEFAVIARELRAGGIAADGVYAESYREALNKAGLALLDMPVGATAKVALWMALAQVIGDDRLALGDLPEDKREDLIDQLSRVVEKRSANGVTIELPRRAIKSEADASAAATDHCDGAVSLRNAVWASGAGAGLVKEQNARPVSIPNGNSSGELPSVNGVSFGHRPNRGGWGRR